MRGKKSGVPSKDGDIHRTPDRQGDLIQGIQEGIAEFRRPGNQGVIAR